MDTNHSIRCPKCASVDVRYSHTQTTWDVIMDLLFSMDAFRCRSCRHRFRKFDPGGATEEDFAAQPAGRRDRGQRDSSSRF